LNTKRKKCSNIQQSQLVTRSGVHDEPGSSGRDGQTWMAQNKQNREKIEKISNKSGVKSTKTR
jgi:hypothetical protein